MPGEAVLFELRHSSRIHGRLLRAGTELHFPTRLRVIADVFPWEALALSLVAGALLFWRLGDDLGSALTLALLLLAATLQVFAERDFVTATRIVSRRGMFGRRRKEMLLKDVERVEVGFPGLMQDEGIGNIILRSGCESMTLWAVANAAEMAERIRALTGAARLPPPA